MFGVKGPRYLRPLIVVGFVLAAAIAYLAFANFAGTVVPYLLFNLSFLLMLGLILPAPRLYAYTFLALFLFLGFWVKFMFHAIMGSAFVEPIGAFDGSRAGWDEALLVSASAACGVIVIRALHLIWNRRIKPRAAHPRERDSFDVGVVPDWYVAVRKPLWLVTLVSILAINLINVMTGTLQVGLVPRAVLPWGSNIIVAWLLSAGCALWISVLVYWEAALSKGSLNYTLFAPLAEGFAASVSVLSRNVFLFHSIPYLFVYIEQRSSLRRVITKRVKSGLMLTFLIGFIVSLVLVSLLRLYAYTYASPATQDYASPATQEGGDMPFREGLSTAVAYEGLTMVNQVFGLFIDRWVGIEGVLAVASHDALGTELFLQGLLEDPNKGEKSIYQIMAQTRYAESEQTTFLTLPGIAAILYYSGSVLLVIAGMSVVTAVLLGIETLFSWLLANPFLLSLGGLFMANVVCQMSSPYLTGVFFVQLVFSLGVIWLIQNVVPRGRRSRVEGT